MAKRKYTQGRPLQEVRLRDWDAGRVAQIKTAIQRLESILNDSAASQIEQPGKREFNQRIPLITDLTVRSGFRNFQVTFTDPKGLQNLLFYEIQHDTNQGFPNPTTIRSPIPRAVLSTGIQGETRFFRVRAVDSKFRVGPFTAGVQARSANFRIETTRVGTSGPHAVTLNNIFQELTNTTYNAVGGSGTVTIHVGMRNIGPTVDGFISLAAEFIILRDGTQIGDTGRMTQQTIRETPVGSIRSEAFIFCTIVTPFESLDAGDTTYSIEGRIVDDDSDKTVAATFPTSVDFFVDVFDISEVVGD